VGATTADKQYNRLLQLPLPPKSFAIKWYMPVEILIPMMAPMGAAMTPQIKYKNENGALLAVIWLRNSDCRRPLIIPTMIEVVAIQINPRVEPLSGSFSMVWKGVIPGRLHTSHHISYHFLGFAG
jgi:hypothetical protein